MHLVGLAMHVSSDASSDPLSSTTSHTASSQQSMLPNVRMSGIAACNMQSEGLCQAALMHAPDCWTCLCVHRTPATAAQAAQMAATPTWWPHPRGKLRKICSMTITMVAILRTGQVGQCEADLGHDTHVLGVCSERRHQNVKYVLLHQTTARSCK